PVQQQDWSETSPEEREARLDAFLETDRQHGFDLFHGPLFRLAVLRFGQADYRVVWTYHAGLLDDRSLRVVVNEGFSLYEASQQGRDAGLPAVRPYQDYVEWCRGQDTTGSEAFWRQLLQGFRAPTPLLGPSVFQPRQGQ